MLVLHLAFHGVQALPHLLKLLTLLLFHLGILGASHLLLHLPHLAHQVLHLVLLSRGHMPPAPHLMHLIHHLVHHVPVFHGARVHPLAPRHGLTFAMHASAPAVHAPAPAMHLGGCKSG